MWRGVDEAIELCGIEGKGVDIRGCIDDLVAVAVETAVGVGVAGSVGAAGAGAGAAGAAGTVSPVAVVAR